MPSRQGSIGEKCRADFDLSDADDAHLIFCARIVRISFDGQDKGIQVFRECGDVAFPKLYSLMSAAHGVDMDFVRQ